MATVTYVDTEDKIRNVTQNIAALNSALTYLVAAQQLEKQLLDRFGTSPAVCQNQVTDRLQAVEAMLTEIRAQLSYVDSNFAFRTKVSPRVFIDYFDVDVDNGASKGVITAKTSTGAGSTAALKGTIDDVEVEAFLAGDKIRISNAEDPDTNGYYIVDTSVKATGVLTLTTILGGSDNTKDTSMEITLVSRTT